MEGFDAEIEFWMKCFKDSLYLMDVVGLCVCSHLLQKEDSLKMDEQVPDLRVQQNVIRNYFIATFVFKEQ